MKVTLSFVPPGGGEQDYSIDMDLVGIPEKGSYIRFSDTDQVGSTRDFIVRRSWWCVEKDPTKSWATAIVVECEFALSASSSDAHKESCDMYKARGKTVLRFEDSAY